MQNVIVTIPLNSIIAMGTIRSNDYLIAKGFSALTNDRCYGGIFENMLTSRIVRQPTNEKLTISLNGSSNSIEERLAFKMLRQNQFRPTEK